MRVIVVSTYPPRRCGLAEFAHDLRAALSARTGWDVGICAVDRGGLTYGAEVAAVIDQDDPRSYRRAARDLSAADVVLIQHEYGIFGGPDGAFVLDLADELRSRRIPYAVTLHTVLAQPTRGQEATLAALCRDAARVTAFSRDAARLAADTGIVDQSHVSMVPHGAPPILRRTARPEDLSPTVAQTLLDVGDTAQVLATFGFVGPGKGIHDAIMALPEVLARDLDVRYIIAGTTHPEVLRRDGNAYRTRLANLATQLRVADRVHFVDTFVTLPELAALLARTDVYLTPYLSPDQACSGALTFALAAGRPVVSTAYRYAVEMLTPRQGNPPGILVPCHDVDALATAVADLLCDPRYLRRTAEAANVLGQTLMWPTVAASFADVCAAAAATGPAAVPHATLPRPMSLCLDHLDRLTDEVGIIEFARGVEPDTASGYCVDDVARLGLVAVDLAAALPSADPHPRQWLGATLRFLSAAVDAAGMHNRLGYDGRWRDSPHRGDHIGRTVWFLGSTAGSAYVGHEFQIRAWNLLDRVLPLVTGDSPIRTLAYAVLGLVRCPPSPEFDGWLHAAAARLMTGYHDDPVWPWYEEMLSYDNARLPQALLAAGARLTDESMVRRGLETLDWYIAQVGLDRSEPGLLRLIGNGGRRNGRREPAVDEGDEQPLDAAAVVEALVEAWRITREPRYARLAVRAFAWFHGANRAVVPVYDPATGGCRDGLGGTQASHNEGAESTLAYHQALLSLVHAGLTTIATHHTQEEGYRWTSARRRSLTTNSSSGTRPTLSSPPLTGRTR
jgi:glycosyltransferase involved in cell wall biosynthesis